MKLSKQEIKNIVKQIDFAGNGRINYSEFIAATINTQELLTDERIDAIFTAFDVDNTGAITAQNIIDSFSKKGKEISFKDLEQIFKQHDENNDGEIDKFEFKQMLKIKKSFLQNARGDSG